jgi:uncharacterized protein (DUF362 family)
MHDVGVVLAGEDIAGAAHVGRQLVHLGELTVDHPADAFRVAQVLHHEVVGLRLGERIELQVDAADPEAFALEALDQVSTDKSARAQNQC